MKRLLGLCAAATLALTGCSQKVAVLTLDAVIRDAAEAAQRGAGDAATDFTIEVGVTNGYKGSATLPIPVVPIGVEATSSVATKLTLKLDLKKFKDDKNRLAPLAEPPRVMILDKSTGQLTEQPGAGAP